MLLAKCKRKVNSHWCKSLQGFISLKNWEKNSEQLWSNQSYFLWFSGSAFLYVLLNQCAPGQYLKNMSNDFLWRERNIIFCNSPVKFCFTASTRLDYSRNSCNHRPLYSDWLRLGLSEATTGKDTVGGGSCIFLRKGTVS